MTAIISDADIRAMEQVVQQNKSDHKHLNWIRRTLKIVRHPKLLKKAVRLNSVVLLWHSVLKKIVKFRIVLPNNADLKTRKLSVFAPISMAILGKQENDLVKVKIGGIEKELKLIKVINK